MTTVNNPAIQTFGCVILSFLTLFLSGCGKKNVATQDTSAVPVTVALVTERDAQIRGSWVATLDGFINADIRPQVSGYLVKQDYREGSLVHAGDVLFEIDPRPFQATLNQAEGQLAAARARLELAKINMTRDVPLAAAHAVAQSQLDTEIQQKAAEEATVQTASANVDQAKLNLGFTTVRSLVTGIAKRTQIQVGNLVSPSTTLTTVSQIDPIKAYFSISEQEYLSLSRRANSREAHDLLRSSGAIPLQLVLGDGTVYSHTGQIIFVDRQIDRQTGTIQIAGSFPNPSRLLRPGQFGRIEAETTVLRHALMIPARAVYELQGTYQVAVVEQNNMVQVRPVKPGPQIGSEWVITEGLRASEHVVIEGISKLRSGMKVQPQFIPDNGGASRNADANAKGH